MTDVFSTSKRSEIMSRVRSRGNAATELRLARLFRKHAISGWRRHAKVFGNPDFVFRKFRLAIFVDGCFWHGCPRHGTRPTSNSIFWHEKLDQNRARDGLVNRKLAGSGWCVVRIWQHDLVKATERDLVQRIRKALSALEPSSSRPSRPR